MYNNLAMAEDVPKTDQRLDSAWVANHFLWVLEMERTINLAVREAQEENRRLGIPNYYEINGRIVSDRPDLD
ncbi:MAG TPA: hypothetical protein VJX67_08435 [Blastocatellia bacterium]|nr:hypothetical protein [Blastocatellia bacterium]